MFTMCPSGGGGILLVARPSASSGTITNATLAYDLPSSRDDDPPYTTSADRATVTGSAVAGTVDYDIVEYNTFPSRSKTNFTQCQLVIGFSATLAATLVSYIKSGFTTYDSTYVTSSLFIEYQVNGSTWNLLREVQCADGELTALGSAANSSTFFNVGGATVPGTVSTTNFTKITNGVTIPAALFSSNLSDLKVRFRLGTCKNNAVTTYQSSGSYSVWDIRANIS